MKKLIQGTSILFLALLFIQCANNTKKDQVEPQTQTAMKDTTKQNLDGLWILESTSKPDFKIKKGTSVAFKGTEFHLNALCNLNHGGVTIKDSEIKFNSKGLMQTMKGCPDNYEQDFLKLLFEVVSFEIQNDILTLTTKDQSKIVWKKQNILTHLQEKEWAVVTNTGDAIVISEDNPKLTMSFSKDGKISGFAGCNTFNGTYKLEGDQIIIENVALTKMACLPEGMKVENNFVKNLNKSIFTVEDSSSEIVFRYKDGAMTFILN